jgi:putative addiction module component (TIGR02574 family)
LVIYQQHNFLFYEAPRIPGLDTRGGKNMSIELPLETLSVSEKIQLLESLWDSLCTHPENVRSPEWHREVLEARERRLEDGQATASPWSEAKARLLNVGR